jgi:hypothetical protein
MPLSLLVQRPECNETSMVSLLRFNEALMSKATSFSLLWPLKGRYLSVFEE